MVLEKHLRNTLFLRICWFLVKVFDSGMNFVSNQNSCFASVAEMTLRCSFNQLPKISQSYIIAATVVQEPVVQAPTDHIPVV